MSNKLKRKAKSKVKEQIRKAAGANLSVMDVCRIREEAKRHADKMENEATARAFLGQLAVPLNILVHDYWPKTARKRAPQFIEEVLSLQDSWVRGIVTDEELENLLFDYTGFRMKDLITNGNGIVYRTFKVLDYMKFEDHEVGVCSRCGKRLINFGDVNFCSKCGTRVTWEVEENECTE